MRDRHTNKQEDRERRLSREPKNRESEKRPEGKRDRLERIILRLISYQVLFKYFNMFFFRNS